MQRSFTPNGKSPRSRGAANVTSPRSSRAGGGTTNGRPPRRRGVPVTDYSLARRMLLSQYRRGVVNIFDICDAHPELLRAAKNIGKPLDRSCPVCSRESLRMVRYVFGEELHHLSGRPVYPDEWARELANEYDEFRCYAVEVCVWCSWNYLIAVYLMGRRYGAREARNSGASTSK